MSSSRRTEDEEESSSNMGYYWTAVLPTSRTATSSTDLPTSSSQTLSSNRNVSHNEDEEESSSNTGYYWTAVLPTSRTSALSNDLPVTRSQTHSSRRSSRNDEDEEENSSNTGYYWSPEASTSRTSASSNDLLQSGSQTRSSRRGMRTRATPNHRSRSRSENGRGRPGSQSPVRDRQRSEERQSVGGLVPGSILAGVESHLLLLRRSLLLLSHLARPTTAQFLEDKPAAPPTSSAFIDNIPESRITTTGVECSICLAKFRRGTRASVLPCKHQFHNKCIRPWLKKKNSCPLCRHELPSDEPSVRRLNPSFLDMYDDFNSFSEAIRATRARVLLNRRNLSDSS